MTFRKEIKFRVSNSDMKIYKEMLLKDGMISIYPKRNVYSCYFDTHDLKLFSASEEGILPRKKIRYRWYECENIVFKEIKISSIEGRYKKSHKLDCNNLLNLKNEYLRDNFYGRLYPKIIVTYERDYFFYKNLRLTIDNNIKYKDLTGIFKKEVRDFENVIEIKTSLSTSTDYLEEIFQTQPSRFSKYSRGILHLKKHLRF